MILNKSKSLLVLTLGLAALLIAGFGIFVFFNADSNEEVQTLEQTSKITKSIGTFEEITAKYYEGDYSFVIDQGLSYARSEDNSTTERLQMYSVCIVAGRVKPDTASKDVCRQEGETLANTLGNQAEIDQWLKLFNRNYEGTPNTTEGFAEDELR